MKKLIRISLAVLMSLSLSGLSWAITEPMPPGSEEGARVLPTHMQVSVVIEVEDLFGFDTWDGEENQYIYPSRETFTRGVPDPDDPTRTIYAEIDPKVGSIHFYCTTNRGNDWYMTASSPQAGCENLLGSGEIWTIPLTMAPFAIATDDNPAGGTFIEITLTTTPQEFYLSEPTDEDYTAGLQFTSLIIPVGGPGAPQGTYVGQIMLDMAEKGIPLD